MAKFCLQVTRRVPNSPIFLWQFNSKNLSLSTWSVHPATDQFLGSSFLCQLFSSSSSSWTNSWQEAKSTLSEERFILVCTVKEMVCYVRESTVMGWSHCASSQEAESNKDAVQLSASMPLPSSETAFLKIQAKTKPSSLKFLLDRYLLTAMRCAGRGEWGGTKNKTWHNRYQTITI